MQSPPTSPRHRGRLQPELHGCGLGIDGLRSSLQREYGRPVFCPAASETFSAEEAAEEATSPNAIEAATHRAFSPPATYAMVPWPPSRKASFTQQTLDILRLVEMLGGVK